MTKTNEAHLCEWLLARTSSFSNRRLLVKAYTATEAVTIAEDEVGPLGGWRVVLRDGKPYGQGATTSTLPCRCGVDVRSCVNGCHLMDCCGGYVNEGHMSDCPGGAYRIASAEAR